ncbi:MAG TPA: zinc-binding alcohol dehydrogenase family protein [Usitatibacter sp.]|jgi:NADPH:quinone reductase-like Zn-dependent oxidoreductase|nr:zinc-binding alcohol dehydrogenase family protein [Usitatibacter sp.]
MAKVLDIAAQAPSADAIRVELVDFGSNRPSDGDVVIEVHAAGINPSDAKAMLGLMPSAVFPRTPGRDYAGVVIGGPKDLLGLEVYGSGGDIGISRNGSHGERLVLPAAAIRRKPKNLTMAQAGTVGVPFVTAYEGLRRAGLKGDPGLRRGGDDAMPAKAVAVAVFGASGKVGQAVVQLATRAGAKVFAVDRRADAPRGFASGAVRYIDASREKAPEVIRGETGNAGANIVFNTVGSPYFAEANAGMAKRGTQVFIATVERAVPFDIFAFYRGMHTYAGVDSLALTAVDCAPVFEALTPGFEDGTLQPFAADAADGFALADAAAAYQRVLTGSTHRLFFAPRSAR